jgi:hypothetical protein
MSTRNFLRYFLALCCFFLTLYSFTECYFALKRAEEIKFYTKIEFVVPEGAEIIINDQPVKHTNNRGSFLTYLSTRGRYHIILKKNGEVLQEIFNFVPNGKEGKLILK